VIAGRDAVAIKKALAVTVILFCLAAQTYAIVRPSGARWWPFIDYLMSGGLPGDALRPASSA
jgi:hypothetical protein